MSGTRSLGRIPGGGGSGSPRNNYAGSTRKNDNRWRWRRRSVVLAFALASTGLIAVFPFLIHVGGDARNGDADRGGGGGGLAAFSLQDFALPREYKMPPSGGREDADGASKLLNHPDDGDGAGSARNDAGGNGAARRAPGAGDGPKDGDRSTPDVHAPLRSRMERRLSSLMERPPSWPQLNHGTAEAIVNDGTILGPPFVSNLTTIVTAYYEFKSKHPVDQYETWFTRLLRTSDPMIVFLEPNSRWVDFVTERRSHAPTILVPRRFDDLVMSTTFAESFWDEQRGIDPEAKVHRGTGVYKIWNEKLVLLLATIELNPFDSRTFTWMDAGYFRQDRNAPKTGQPVVKTNITKAGVDASKVLFVHIRDPETGVGGGGVLTAGNGFSGTSHALRGLYDRYFTTFWDMVLKKEFVGSDQKVMARVCYRHPSTCHLHFPGRFKDWFALARVLRNDGVDLSEQSPKFRYTSEPIEDPPPPPEGIIVTNAVK